MSSALGSFLNISFIFLWNVSPTGTVLKGNLAYMYLLNWHPNGVKCDDFPLTSGCDKPELASKNVR